MQKWEYKRIRIGGSRYDRNMNLDRSLVDQMDGIHLKSKERPLFDDYLQELGSQGWEMVGFMG